MRSRQEARVAVLNMQAVEAQIGIEKPTQRIEAAEVADEPALVPVDVRGDTASLQIGVDFVDERVGAFGNAIIKGCPLALDMVQDRSGSRQYHGMTNECARKERRRNHRHRVITVVPV